MNIVSMDRVSIRRDMAGTWSLLMQHTLPRLGIEPLALPEEQARLEQDGALTIYISLPDRGEVKMRVEPDGWKWFEP